MRKGSYLALMRKFIVMALLALLGIALVVFFVANRQPVYISMDPFNLDQPAFALGPLPMWAALAITLFIGYGLGAVGMWLSDGTLRRRAKERKAEIRRLKKELELASSVPPQGEGRDLTLRG
ncbi:MAG: LapA family protein [Pseudomonadota bacterium]